MDNTILFNKTKIVATVGPASNNKQTLTDLVKAGVDVFRLNFSHGSHEDHLKVIRMVQEINEELGTNIALLQDLQGPKIRTNMIKGGEVEIKEGQQLVITTKDGVEGDDKVISTTYKALPNDVTLGDKILIDDGKLELKVEKSGGDEVTTRVIHGGSLKSRKGINLPDTRVSAASLTDKDEKDLAFGMTQEIDWVALSFVRSAVDIHHLKEKIKAAGRKTLVIAKIEKPEAIDNIDEIIEATDGIMVARGDLGVEIAMQDVPMQQKIIVEKCNRAGKPVIIATQMLESMIENPRPTRAEANDVANGVLDGADAVMLSAESAAGKFPILAVKAMANIIKAVEDNSQDIYNKFYEDGDDSLTRLNDKLVRAACRLSMSVEAKAIIGMTKSGYTGYKLASHRPNASIFIFTDKKPLLRAMNLVWGIRGFYYDKMEGIDDTFDHLEEILVEKGHLFSGDIYINTASMPLHWKTHTNMIKVSVTG
ncbi:MAG: pyruvate kinase [Bacteroidota bacterium]